MGKGLGEGCCSALSAMYVGSRADWSVFKNIIQTPGGKAHVRGLQNLNITSGKLGSFNFKNLFEVYRNVMSLFGARFSGHQRFGETGDADAGLIGFARVDGLFYFTFWGEWGGHTIAAAKQGDTFKLFDPNCGEATIPGASNFARFVTWWLKGYYGEINRWAIQRCS